MAINNEKLRMNNNGNQNQLLLVKTCRDAPSASDASLNMAKDIVQPNAQFENDEGNEKIFFAHEIIQTIIGKNDKSTLVK